MITSQHAYYHDGLELHGYVARDEASDIPRPAVLVAPDWSGRNAFACQKAELLASMGYLGFALDMYGHGRVGETLDERMALMQPLINDRKLLRLRIRAALDAVTALPEVDSTRVAAIGFCFGGLCVLDLARSGARLKGVVSFHGLLGSAKDLPNESIHAKMLVLHGYDDPMVTPDDVNAFCQEMTLANVDWQVHQYGHTKHAFANPQAHDDKLGTVYNAVAERRSLQSMSNFLQELFE
jgi:dienelactone hydrolase